MVALLLASFLVGDPAGAAAPRIVTAALPVPAGYTGSAEDVNSSGQVAGWVALGATGQPVRWDGNTRVDLPLGELPGGSATEINDAGTVAGLVGGGPGGRRMVRLGTLGGPTSAPLMTGRGVSRTGDIVGTSVTASGQTHGFRWRLGRMTDIGTLGGPSSTPAAINDPGQIAGSITTADGTRPVVWTVRP